MEFEFVTIQREFGSNNAIIQVKVSPPLKVFLDGGFPLTSVFDVTESSVAVNDVHYDPTSQTITFAVAFDESFASEESLSVSFVPSETVSAQFFASIISNATFAVPKNFANDFIFYSESSLLIISFLPIAVWISVVSVWIAVVIGMFSRHLAGLEALAVVQFTFFSVLWLNSYLFIPFRGLSALRFSTGYNHNFATLPQTSE